MNAGNWRLPAFGALAFAVSLLVTLPAAVAARLLPLPAGLGAASLDGTLWSGVAIGVGGGPLRVEKLRWDLAVLPLLAGRLVARIDADSGLGRGSFTLGARRDGTLTVGDAAGTLRVDALARLASAPAGFIDGELQLSGVNLRISGGRVTALECAGSIGGLHATAPQRVELGDLTIVCSDSPAGPEIRIEDQGGPLSVQAQVLLSEDGRWALNATLGARPGAAPALRQVLPLLGAPDGPDRVRVKLAGTLVLPAL
jgi:hypothetical protein